MPHLPHFSCLSRRPAYESAFPELRRRPVVRPPSELHEVLAVAEWQR